MSDKIIHLTDDSFDTDVLKADGLTLVDFWAEWCGPCKMIAPILDEIAEEYQGKLTVAKLNIDQNPGTAPKYGIRGIPTLLLFKNGEVAATKVGALSKGQLKEFLDANLAKQIAVPASRFLFFAELWTPGWSRAKLIHRLRFKHTLFESCFTRSIPHKCA